MCPLLLVAVILAVTISPAILIICTSSSFRIVSIRPTPFALAVSAFWICFHGDGAASMWIRAFRRRLFGGTLSTGNFLSLPWHDLVERFVIRRGQQTVDKCEHVWVVCVVLCISNISIEFFDRYIQRIQIGNQRWLDDTKTEQNIINKLLFIDRVLWTFSFWLERTQQCNHLGINFPRLTSYNFK